MIQANISEVKNRLSYYLKLVRGGEQIEILDRKTPLARIVHVSGMLEKDERPPAWIQEARELGLITPPLKGPIDAGDFAKGLVAVPSAQKKPGVLQALLDERENGR